MVTGQVFGQKTEVIVALPVFGSALFIQARPGGHVEFAADEGFDPVSLGGGEELDGAKQITVIRER